MSIGLDVGKDSLAAAYQLQKYNTENSKQIFPEKELWPLSPYFPIHVSVSSPFQGPKKSRFSGQTPSSGIRNGFARIKIVTSRAILTASILVFISWI